MIERDTLVNALESIERYEGNPIASPSSQNETLANYYGVYNGDVFFDGEIYHGVFRCESKIRDDETRSTVGHYTSDDGYKFNFNEIIILDNRSSIDDPRVFRHKGFVYVASTQVDPETGKQTLHLTKATEDFKNFEFLGLLPLRDGEPYSDHKGIRSFVPVVDENKELVEVNGSGYFGYCYHNLPNGEGLMFGFYIEDIEDLESYMLASKEPVMIPKPGTFYGNLVEPGPTPILTNDSIIVIVFAGEDRNHGVYYAGITELDCDDPTRVIGVCEKPILIPQEEYEIELNPNQAGRDGGIIFPSGICLDGEVLRLYYGAADKHLCVATSELG